MESHEDALIVNPPVVRGRVPKEPVFSIHPVLFWSLISRASIVFLRSPSLVDVILREFNL